MREPSDFGQTADVVGQFLTGDEGDGRPSAHWKNPRLDVVVRRAEQVH